MQSAVSSMRRAACLLSCLVALLFARVVPAQTIDVSLNVFYTNPLNINSGGTWELVAKSGNSGIAGLSVLIEDITTAQNEGPRGTVNGSDLAGFGFFANTLHPLGFRQVTMGQAPLAPGTVGPGEEQTVFYGVGTLANGAPNYPMKPPGTNSIGPAFTSLTNVLDVAWATGDAFGNATWSTAARLASGTFAAGLSPNFFQGEGFAHSGNVFATLGTSTTAGTLAEQNITAIVRSNFTGTLLPDYNENGFVDAPDFVLWRNTFGMMGTGLAADGNGDGTVNFADYLLWRAHFGAMAGAGASASLSTGATGATAGLYDGAIPEPTCGMLLAIGATLCGFGVRRVR